MHITVAAPRRPGVASGNDVTAARWARRLRELGHTVTEASVEPGDVSGVDVAAGTGVLIALHARRCASAVAASRHHQPGRPIVVGLAGTDLYADLPDDPAALASVRAADQLVVLQPAAVERLAAMDPALGAKAHVVHQSVEPPVPRYSPPTDRFVVVVLAHLRDVKDPLLAARAAGLLDRSSTVEVHHAGHAHDQDWHQRALVEQAANPRYRWLGEVGRPAALDLLAHATVLACTSVLEGGANVVTEAIAVGVPIVGTAIDGTIGLLGKDYPGLVPVGDSESLASWLAELEAAPDLLQDLAERVRQRQAITAPAAEREAWSEVLKRLPEAAADRG